MTESRKKARLEHIVISALTVFILGVVGRAYAQEKKEPIIINGDKVEYSTDNKEVTASGEVEVIYKGAKLSCKKLSVNTQTKDAVAEGNARLQDERGVIEGERLVYNFQTKTGTIVNASFRANPYFFKVKKLEKVSDNEFIARKGYATTCNLDRPHYRIAAQRINIFPNDKIQTKEDIFYLANIPLLYLSQYNHSLKDPMMHVQVMPGKKKEWGPYLLTAWRYNLTDNIDGRVYLDYREKLGLAEGFGANYTTPLVGKGDFKFYYTEEKDSSTSSADQSKFQRYLVRWRHQWAIDENTNFTSEFYKISDQRRKKLDPERNILKDYFYREYEEDSQPLSYALLHHSLRYSSIDVLVQKRTNQWYDQIEKLPEIKYTLPSFQIGDSRFYFEDNTTLANLNKKATTSPVSNDDVTVARLDTTNKFSLPMKVAFVELTPFVANRETIYDRGVEGQALPMRTIFYTGADASTKFYRIFNVKTNFLGMDINGLRHVITPTISYKYNHEPTVLASKLKQVDDVDSVTRSNAATLELSNKLQTKRKGVNVDLLDARVTTTYIFKPKTPTERSGSHLSDFLFNIKFLPYSWLRFEGDATYKRSGLETDENYNRFSDANYDINFDFGKDRSFGLGQRYERKGGNEITASFKWRINPKWKFAIYNRYELGHGSDLDKGLKEQEYTLTRDLHCWIMDITLNTKINSGSTIWFIFRLKAFPEMEFGINQSYRGPKSGSQENP